MAEMTSNMSSFFLKVRVALFLCFEKNTNTFAAFRFHPFITNSKTMSSVFFKFIIIGAQILGVLCVEYGKLQAFIPILKVSLNDNACLQTGLKTFAYFVC